MFACVHAGNSILIASLRICLLAGAEIPLVSTSWVVRLGACEQILFDAMK